MHSQTPLSCISSWELNGLCQESSTQLLSSITSTLALVLLQLRGQIASNNRIRSEVFVNAEYGTSVISMLPLPTSMSISSLA